LAHRTFALIRLTTATAKVRFQFVLAELHGCLVELATTSNVLWNVLK